jgi:MFS family permease
MLDAMDVLLYVFALQTLRAEFRLTNAQAGLVSSITLVASAFGGIATGWLSDRFGRKRMLIYTILVYSFASAGTASSNGLAALLFWRAIVGLGLGGEWSAGATLVAESWPPEHRAKAIGVMQSGWAMGYMLAAVVSAIVLPSWGWRALFLVGVLPALLTLGIRRSVEEPRIWRQNRAASSPAMLFRPPLARRTYAAAALASATLLGYWGLFTWLPAFLSASKESGGAGLDIVKTSAWIFAMQTGALAGYLSFGVLADRFGRRPIFVGFVLSAAVLTPVFGLLPLWGGEAYLLWLAPFMGFAGSGYFSLFGAMLAELYPTSIRSLGVGFTYNVGRILSAGAPVAVGAIADRHGIGSALALNSAFFCAAAVLIYLLPETRNKHLE